MKCFDKEELSKCPVCKIFSKDGAKCIMEKFGKKTDEAEIQPADTESKGFCTLCAIVGAVVLLGTAAFFIFKFVLKCVKDTEE